MKAHDLARKLLEGPDSEVTLSISCSKDTISTVVEHDGGEAEEQEIVLDGISIAEIEVKQEGDQVDIQAWMSACNFGWMD